MSRDWIVVYVFPFGSFTVDEEIMPKRNDGDALDFVQVQSQRLELRVGAAVL